MNQEDFIRIAREAGLAPICSACDEPDVSYAYEDWDEELKGFANLVAEREREECAKVCESNVQTWSYPGSITRDECAAAIRARGEK